MKNEMNGYCDREEIIASYLDRTLPESERREFEKHLATCDECLSELIAAQTELREMSSERLEETSSRRSTGKRRAGGWRYAFGDIVPRGRVGIFAAALSGLTAAMAVVFLVATMQSHMFDPDYREGVHLLGKLMDVRDAGELKLAGVKGRAVATNNIYRGDGMLQRNLSIRAGERLEKALARHPGNAEVLSALGHFHMVDGQPEMAGIYYEWALRVHPDDPVLLNNLAAASYRTGKTTEAERLLLEAEHHQDPPPECYFNLGVLYGETGQRELQRIHLELYIGMAPDSPWAEEARRMLETVRP